MERRIEQGHLRGLLGVGIQFVGDVEVVEAGLQNERGGIREDAFDTTRGGDEQFMHLLPRYVVADRDSRMQHQPVGICAGAVIDDVIGEYQRVRNRDIDILDRSQSDNEQVFAGDVADGIRDLYSVSDLEGPHVGDHDAGDHVGDGRCGTE